MSPVIHAKLSGRDSRKKATRSEKPNCQARNPWHWIHSCDTCGYITQVNADLSYKLASYRVDLYLLTLKAHLEVFFPSLQVMLDYQDVFL